MIELLAPAGNFEALKAAVLNGANAVYLGGTEFSARASAGNFNREEMVEALRFCHAYDVKVYVTMNTLLRNEELKGALEYAAFLYGAGVDALIIQDTGFLKLLRQQLPELELHGSTQMTAHNLDAVNLLYDMGLSRVVLSRELSLDEIRYIVKNTRAEIEVFVHGALCISFSGQCLMSSMIGGRSGNRGRCAQPCRMQYTIDKEKEKLHFLSPKDLSTLDFIEELVEAGVHSLKIEGRMKRPEYVATVISSYRRAIDDQRRPEDVHNVTQIFNRGGFTTAFMRERQGRDMMSFERPKNWGTFLGRVISVKGRFANIALEQPLRVGDGVEIFGKNTGAPVGSIKVKGADRQEANSDEVVEIYLEGASKGDVIYKSLDSRLVKEAEESYTGRDVRRMPLYGAFRARRGETISLTVIDSMGNQSEARGEEPEKALKTPTARERVREALSKTGDTYFYFEEIEIDMDEDIVVPISKLNSLRREALEGILEKLQGKREEKKVSFKLEAQNKRNKPQIVVQTGRIELARAAAEAGVDIIFFGGDRFRINSGSLSEALKLRSGKTQVYPWYPEIILDEYDKLRREAESLRDQGVEAALCGNMGFYKTLRENGIEAFLDKGFNTFNSPSAEAFENRACLVSPELNLIQMRDAIGKTGAKTMINAYGRIKLMVMRHCTIGSAKGHGREGCPTLCENRIHHLNDRTGESNLIVTDWYCRSHIFSPKRLLVLEHMKDIMSLNADYLMLNFLDETPEEAELVVSAYRESVERAWQGDIRNTGLEKKLIEYLEGNITKGHLFKGVD